MPTRLTAKAIEQSTFVIILSFYDTSGAAVTPNAVSWTLTDRNGVVVNNRENVDIIEMAEEIPIVLFGNDLKVLESGVTRILTVRAYYDSTFGTNLPLNDECRFEIQNLVDIT